MHVLHQKRKRFPNIGLAFKHQGVISMGEKLNRMKKSCKLKWTGPNYDFLPCIIIPQICPHYIYYMHKCQYSQRLHSVAAIKWSMIPWVHTDFTVHPSGGWGHPQQLQHCVLVSELIYNIHFQDLFECQY